MLHRILKMTVKRTQTLFAWLPTITTSGKRIFFKKYVRQREYVYGLAGEGPALLTEVIFIPKEYTLYLLRKSK